MNAKKIKNYWKPIVLIIIIFTFFFLSRTYKLGKVVAELRNWIYGLGYLGPFVFVLLYIAAVIAAVPGSAITIVAGALFGSLWGTIIVSIGSTIGAGICFLISRYFARAQVASWLSEKEKYQKLDKLTEEHGAIIVAITRLIPIFPFNLLNYSFGLTRVKFHTYIFWSWLCMLPGTILYVVGTDTIARAIRKGDIPWFFVSLFIFALVIVVVLAKFAKSSLNKSKKLNKKRN